MNPRYQRAIAVWVALMLLSAFWLVVTITLSDTLGAC
jgi:hypothetical protein